MTTAIVTPAHIAAALETIRRNPGAQRPLPTTPKRREQAILAAGRDAIATLLIHDVPYVTWNNLTAAIRRGHQGTDTDFAAINRAGAVALNLIPTSHL
jgi:hypothetical protein